MYSDGYLHQRVRNDGWQEDVEEKLDRDNAPVKRVLGRGGNQMVLQNIQLSSLPAGWIFVAG